jgi:hypothetical protein
MSSVELVLGRGIADQSSNGPVTAFRARILVPSAGSLPDLVRRPVVLDDASISPRASAPKEVLVDALVIVVIALAAIAILDLLAVAFGTDSRDLGDESPVGLTA